MDLHFNGVGIIVCALLGTAVQGIWYAPKAFGPSAKDPQGSGGEGGQVRQMASAALGSGVMAVALAGFLNYFHSETFLQGALAGAQLWLGFVAPALAMDRLASERPWRLHLIHAAPILLSLILMGGILALWK